jgi:flagellar M-ring protein FliF
MDALKRLLNIPASQMIGLAVAVVTVGGFLIGVWMWLQTPDYRVLFTNLGDRDGGAVVASLSQMNVPYKYNDGGSAIMVPANLIYDTRLKLASQGLPKGGTVGFELLDQQKFGTTQLQEQVNFQRGLEGELSKSIQSVASVQAARVHLAIPKPTIFLREHQKPTASVLVTLFPGKTLDSAQVQGIVHLVSSSVPELADQNVSIVDGSGNLLSRPADIGGLDPGKLAYLHELEQSYTRRVTSIIETIVGVGNVRAEVTADLDFAQTEQTAETFKPNAPQNAAMRSSQSTEASNSTGGAGTAGVPGAQANTPTNAGAPAPSTPAGASGSNSTSSTKKDNTVNYELDRTVETRRLPVGTIKRLSAAIVINNRTVPVKVDPNAKKDPKADPNAKPATTSEPLKKEELDQITALAREALGFDDKRGDSLNVVNTSFTQPEILPPTDVPVWKDPDNLSTAKEVGKNLGFALIAGYLLFGVLRPAIRRVTASSASTTADTPAFTQQAIEATPAPALAYPEHLQRARELARSDPKAIAGLVRNWVAAE